MSTSRERMMQLIEKYLPYILLAILAGLFVVTRLWRLVTIPYGNHIDEAGVAYDAWCISQYGVDRYMKSVPLYFQNTGGGQSVLCTYMTAVLYKLFGFQQMFVRIPGVFYSLLTVIFTMLLVRKILPKRPYLAIGAGFIVTICPVFIFIARFGLDCHMMLGGTAMFLYFFVCALTDGRYRYYVLAGITGGLMLYTYVLSYVMLPVFLVLAFVYVLSIRKFQFPKWVAMGVPLFLLALPLITIQMINLLDLPEMQVGIFSLTKIIGYRSGELEGFDWNNISEVLRNIFRGDDLEHNSVPGFDNMYWISIPLIVIGLLHVIVKLVISIKKRTLDILTIVFLWFMAVFLVMCSIITIVYRMNSIYFTLAIFIVDAISLIPLRWKWFGRIVKTGIAVTYGVFFLNFCSYYYMGQYTADYYQMNLFDVNTSEAFQFIREHPEYGPKGVQIGSRAIYVALSSLESPYELGAVELGTIFLKDGYYHCNCLGAIEEGYYYVVRDTFMEYSDKLRAQGFTENKYTNYSLFYKLPQE